MDYGFGTMTATTINTPPTKFKELSHIILDHLLSALKHRYGREALRSGKLIVDFRMPCRIYFERRSDTRTFVYPGSKLTEF